MQIDSPNHQAILDRFIAACQADPRVLAATLYGSHARDAADEWSDLDIGVIVADENYDDFAAGREDFMRRWGEPLFIEDFDSDGILFFILADGTEGELSIDRTSNFIEPHGQWRTLVDKTGVSATAKPHPAADVTEQVETLRRQVAWFFHDLSHFITAMGRDQLWWAAGQLEIVRRVCINLARLHHDFDDGEVGDEPWFKLDKALPPQALAGLEATFVPLERSAMLAAAQIILDFYRSLAVPLAEAHGIPYPSGLERLMSARLKRLASPDNSL
ncbi:MAG: aminoglycoside 6-adenylyltransferase [Candidatus Promineofilum sp.]|nr:aminoglycoside 6-adenylyltransferase [Promineifilum sp.]